MPEAATMTSTEKAARNDRIRAILPLTHKDDRFVITRGIEALGPDGIFQALRTLKAIKEVEEGNDHYGERDFIPFDLPNGERAYFKVDDYNGHDGIRCVITLLLADEH